MLDTLDARLDKDDPPPCHVQDDTEFQAAVEAGLAQIDEGLTVPFQAAAAELRRLIDAKA